MTQIFEYVVFGLKAGLITSNKQTNKQETKIIKIILQQKGKRNNYNKQTKKANELKI